MFINLIIPMIVPIQIKNLPLKFPAKNFVNYVTLFRTGPSFLLDFSSSFVVAGNVDMEVNDS